MSTERFLPTDDGRVIAERLEVLAACLDEMRREQTAATILAALIQAKTMASHETSVVWAVQLADRLRAALKREEQP